MNIHKLEDKIIRIPGSEFLRHVIPTISCKKSVEYLKEKSKEIRGQFHKHVYAQRLCTQIPKIQKDTDHLT